MSPPASILAILVSIALVAGCGSSRPPASSAGQATAAAATVGVPSATPPVPGLSWTKAAGVERPDVAFRDEAAPTAPAGPGTAGHPGHFPGQAIVDDVAATADRHVAVGYVGLRGEWTAIAWTSTDAEMWSLASIDADVGSFAVSVVSSPTDLVAVGRSARAAVAWTSSDGRQWTRRPMPGLPGDSDPERATVVVATPAGFLAGGSIGPELGERRARFWRSADGATWEAVPDDRAFADAEVVAIAAAPSGHVALGRIGTGQRSTGSVAWTSPDGATWTRASDAALADGLAAAVAIAPDGSLVAVGSDTDEREAVVWRSADGSSWERVPGEESRVYNEGDKIRMTDVTPVPGGLVAVGNFVGLQYGTATSWRSEDGTSWTRAAAYPALEQGEMLAVSPGGPGLVAVGSFGAPDNYIPAIWSSGLGS